MAIENYEESLKRLLTHEGGYTHHPSDPGGPTNFGITIHDYRQYVKPGAIAADVKAMRLDEAKAIYRAKYWDALRCDALPAGVDYCVFDYGVNSGIGRAARVLQRVVGVADDGRVGPQTLAAVKAREPKAIVTGICDERLAFLQRLKTWPVFGKGWGRRVAEVRAASLALADRAVTALKVSTSAPCKGVVPLNTAARKRSAGGAIAAGGVSATQAGEPSAVLIIVAITIVAAIAAWLFWRWWQQRQQLAAI